MNTPVIPAVRMLRQEDPRFKKEEAPSSTLPTEARTEQPAPQHCAGTAEMMLLLTNGPKGEVFSSGRSTSDSIPVTHLLYLMQRWLHRWVPVLCPNFAPVAVIKYPNRINFKGKVVYFA